MKQKSFLSAATGESAQTGIDIAVDGRSLPVQDGVAKYTATPNTTGVKRYKATIKVTNPVTNEENVYENSFEYEVGVRSVSVAADKMNVFYIGVKNPISVSAAGVSSNALQVSGEGSGITLANTAPGKFDVTVKKPGTPKSLYPVEVSRPHHFLSVSKGSLIPLPS